MMRQAIETELHPNNKNRESWKPLICSLNDRIKPLSRDSRSRLFAGHKLCPLWEFTSLHPDVPASFPYLLLGLFDTEDGGDMFLRNIG
jgi:hypothetical protein